VPEIEAILAKKTEGRSLSPEEYQQLAHFVDRVETRTIEVQAEADQAEQERLAEARADIPPAAFEMMLADSEMKDHVFNILFEAEYETVGDLMLALRLDPDQVFSLPGIGPKAIENITEVLAAIEFPEAQEETEEAEVEEAAEEVEDVAEAVAEAVEEEAVEAEEPAEETEQAEVEVEAEEESEIEEDMSMDEIFEVQPEMLTKPSKGDEEEEDDEFDEFTGKKKKGKKKKYVKYEFDPELGEVVAKKRRKPKSNDWDLDEFDEGDW
jgi:transcription termination/antitermination protein NusA